MSKTKTGSQRSILHVDGDGFFAGVEVAKNPSLKGKPVIVGRERGLALALTYEAKACGVRRGMRAGEVRQLCPDAVWCDMDFESYELFSERMNRIIARYSPSVEHYSIDESFADLSGTVEMRNADDLGMEIKETLKRELGMTFSLGIASSKVLAKVASKHRKPDGLVVITPENARGILEKTPIGKIWGIGRATSRFLEDEGVSTAWAYREKSEGWVRDNLAKPYQELWRELRGESVLPLNTGARDPYKSLMRTRTFGPPTCNRKFLLAELARHAEVVASRAREHGLAGRVVSFFLKTQDFRYHFREVKLIRATHTPEDLIAAIDLSFDEVFREETLYRAAGVTLSGLLETPALERDLFDRTRRIERLEHLYGEIDALNRRFHRPLVHLAASAHLLRRDHARDEAREISERTGLPVLGEIA